MKAAIVLTLLLVAVYAVPEEHWDFDEEPDLDLHPHVDKRFIGSLVHEFNKLKHKITDTFHKAKDQFHEAVGHLHVHVNFDEAVQKLIPLIDSAATETACSAACIAGASSVLGPAAPAAGLACTPLCKVALSKLEDVAG